MENKDIKSRLIQCIKEAHLFSNKLGGESSIHYDYLIENLTEFTSTEIYQELLELHDAGKVEYKPDSQIIILKDNFIN